MPGEPQVLRVHDLDLLVPTAGTRRSGSSTSPSWRSSAAAAPSSVRSLAPRTRSATTTPTCFATPCRSIEQALRSVNRVSLRLIDPRASAATHVDPVLGPRPLPRSRYRSRPGLLGPSGTASPIMNLLDAFFGRPRHDSQLGREILAHRSAYPRHWQQFLTAVDGGVGCWALRSDAGCGGAAYQSRSSAYAGEDGFLGRHRRKVYGYLAVAFTVGRDLTIGGFTGPPQARRWDDVDLALRASRAERLSDRPVQTATPPKQVTSDPARPVLAGDHRGRAREAQRPGARLVDRRGRHRLRRHRLPPPASWRRGHPPGARRAGRDRRLPPSPPGPSQYIPATAPVRRRAAAPPPLDDPGSPYWSLAAALRQAVELQNTFRLDRSFLRGTLLNGPSGAGCLPVPASTGPATCTTASPTSTCPP